MAPLVPLVRPVERILMVPKVEPVPMAPLDKLVPMVPPVRTATPVTTAWLAATAMPEPLVWAEWPELVLPQVLMVPQVPTVPSERLASPGESPVRAASAVSVSSVKATPK